MEIEDLQEKFPFLSGIRHKNIEMVGIIQNHDDKVMSFYDFDLLKSEEDKKLFLHYGETWWWESNRQVPINIFLYGKMKHFRYCLKTMQMKDVQILFGTPISLNNLVKKRIKRRQIQLVK